MAVRGSIQYRGGSPAGVMKSLIDGAREGVEESAAYWGREYLEGHFDTSAAEKYGYQPRQKKYQIRKARKFHHQQPLVFTGTSKSAAMGSRTAKSRLRGDAVEGYLALPVPRYFYQRKDSSYPDKAAELTAVTDGETEVLTHVVENIMARHAAAAQSSSR